MSTHKEKRKSNLSSSNSDNKSSNSRKEFIKTNVNDSVVEQKSTLDSLSMGLSKFILFSTFAAALASFNAGYNTGVTNIPNEAMRGKSDNECYSGSFPKCIYTNSTFLWGLAIGLFALGGCFGSLFSGKLSDTLGRRNALIVSNIPFIIGGILLSTTTSIAQLGLGRFFVGMGSGSASVLVSSYIGEIATAKRRGTLGTFLQLTMVIGILSSNILGYILPGSPSWRILLAITVVPSIIQMAVLPICKETPRYLIMKNDMNKAHTSLQKLREGHDIEKEFDEMVQAQNQSGSSKPLPVWEIFKEKKYVKNILVILVVHIIQQISGINGVITYSTKYFNDAIGEKYSSICTIALSFLNLICTLIGVFLIDRTGRKKLLLFSCLGLCASSAMIVVGSLMDIKIMIVVFVMVFIATFAVGLGPIPWLLMSEMFPTKLLSGVTALSNGVNWLFNFIVTMSFLSINELLGNYTFLLFAIITGIAFAFVMIMLPETKGKSLDQIYQN